MIRHSKGSVEHLQLIDYTSLERRYAFSQFVFPFFSSWLLISPIQFQILGIDPIGNFFKHGRGHLPSIGIKTHRAINDNDSTIFRPVRRKIACKGGVVPAGVASPL